MQLSVAQNLHPADFELDVDELFCAEAEALMEKLEDISTSREPVEIYRLNHRVNSHTKSFKVHKMARTAAILEKTPKVYV